MGQLDELIARCDNALENCGQFPKNINEKSIRRGIYQDYRNCYAKEINQLTGKAVFVEITHSVKKIDIEDIRKLLLVLRERRDHELAVAQANAGMVNVSNSSSNIAIASANVDFQQTIEKVEQIPNDELSEDDKDALLGMLSRLELAERNNSSSVKGKAVRLIKWLGDKSADVIVAVAPVVLKSMLGQ